MKQLWWIPLGGMYAIAWLAQMGGLLGAIIGTVGFVVRLFGVDAKYSWWEWLLTSVWNILVFGTAVMALSGLNSMRDALGLGWREKVPYGLNLDLRLRVAKWREDRAQSSLRHS